MTKITIIGNPGKHNLSSIERLINEYQKKLGLSLEEIYIAFFGNTRQLIALYRKFQRRFCSLNPEDLLVAKIHFTQITQTAYIYKKFRKEEISPVILIRRSCEIKEEAILDEMIHIKEEKKGWIEEKEKAHELFLKDSQNTLAFSEKEVMGLPLEIRNMVNDFFSDEIACRYGFPNMILERRQEDLNKLVKIFSSKKTMLSESYKLYLITVAAYNNFLPPSYPEKKDGERLENIVIHCIRQMMLEQEYHKIKSIFSRLESPPELANIYMCEIEIIELLQELLEKQ